MHKKRLLGEILIERKKITHAQLRHVLATQKKEGGYSGQILIKLGYITEQDIMTALAVQFHLPYIAVDHYEIKREVAELIPSEMARRYCIMPLDRVGDVLSLVMLDPLDMLAKVDVHRHTRCSIVPFISTRRKIERAIDQCYGANR